jgi:hypothetical protein
MCMNKMWSIECWSNWYISLPLCFKGVDSSWNVMARGDAREGKWRGNWRMDWVASSLHTASEHAVSSITTADAHTSAASSRLNWRPRQFKWTRPFRRKTKSGFCACAITFQTQSNNILVPEKFYCGPFLPCRRQTSLMLCNCFCLSGFSNRRKLLSHLSSFERRSKKHP